MNKPIFTKVAAWKAYNESNSGFKYELHFTDGIRQMLKGNDPEKLISEVTSKPEVREWALFKNGPGFHSTTQEEFLVKWWDKYEDGGYWSNMAKKNPALMDKKYGGTNESSENNSVVYVTPEELVEGSKYIMFTPDQVYPKMPVKYTGRRDEFYQFDLMPNSPSNSMNAEYNADDMANIKLLPYTTDNVGVAYKIAKDADTISNESNGGREYSEICQKYDNLGAQLEDAIEAKDDEKIAALKKEMEEVENKIHELEHADESVVNEAWTDKVQDVYSSLEELEEYDANFGIVKRLGYETAADLWEANPTISGSTNPADFKVAEVLQADDDNGEGVAVPAFFTIDDEKKYAGFTFGDDWNGFACPYFEKEVADQMALDMTGRAVGDTYIFEQEDDEPLEIQSEIIKTSIGDKKVWPIGAYYWIWSETTI